MVFGAQIHPRDHPHAQDAGPAGQCGLTFGKTLGWQTVSDYSDFAWLQTLVYQALRGSPRVANHAITPAKGRHLGARLSGGEKVAHLPLTADYDWNS
jgi:hypothetical protein